MYSNVIPESKEKWCMMSKDDKNPSFVCFHHVANKGNVGQDSIAWFLATGNNWSLGNMQWCLCISHLEMALLRRKAEI